VTTTTSLVVHRASVDSIPVEDAKAWRDDLLQQRRAGARLLTLYARFAGFARREDAGPSAGVTMTAVLRAPDGTLRISRTNVTAEHGYHELTTEWPAVHCFEREMHEQTGVHLAGHPWLKPLRYEGQEQSAMNAYPFYKVEGKEIHEVAVGPIHAGVIEPGSFRFMCHGEQVLHLEIQLGYQHRGVERRLLEGDPLRLAPLVETIAGDTSVAHAWAYCAAVEKLAGVDLALDLEVARAVALELERVGMHLGTLSGLAADTGYLQGAATYGRLRTVAINTTMRLCRSRFGRGALRPGGIGMTLPPDLLADVRANLDLLRTDGAIINRAFSSARTVQHRLRSVGVLTASQARDLGVVGTAARASGVKIDVRQQMPQGAYEIVPIATHVFDEGDCFARARVRMAEIDASLDWLAAILALYPTWAPSRAPLGSLAPSQLVVAVAEGWRGEVVHCLETDETGRLAHYKVQDPSLRNWMGLAIALRKNEISDFPICNKSFDLSYCGHDL
jgi:Ni,Fe-hydrogenase III large subunit